MTAKVNLGTSDMKSVTMNLGTYDMQAKMNAKGFDVRDCPKEDYPMFEDEYKDW